MKRTIILLTILALMGLSKSATAQTDTLVSMKSNADTISISVKWPLSAFHSLRPLPITHNRPAIKENC